MTDKLARAKLARAARQLNAQSGSALSALVLMTDDERLSDPLVAARALPRGSTVILRTRDATKRRMLAERLRPLTRARTIKFLVADDTSLARRVGADGIHLPQAKAHEATHWRALHPGWIITAAAHDLNACRASAVDAVFLSPVFATASHAGGKTLGAIQLRLLAQQSAVPVYALGGIDAMTAISLRGAKLVGLAAIDALQI